MDQDTDLNQTITMERSETMIVPTICSRCNTIFKLPRWLVEEGKRIGASHGLCPTCHDILLMEHEELLKSRSEQEQDGETPKRWVRFVQPFLNAHKPDQEENSD